VAVDASANSQKAFQWALDNFIRDGDLVVLTTVREPVLVPGAYGTSPIGRSFDIFLMFLCLNFTICLTIDDCADLYVIFT
jgi:hypothetical protein